MCCGVMLLLLIMFIYIGITLAIFTSSGNIPVLNDKL